MRCFSICCLLPIQFSFPGNAISQSSHGIRCFQVAFAIRHAEYNPRKHHCITVPNKSQDVGDVWEILSYFPPRMWVIWKTRNNNPSCKMAVCPRKIAHGRPWKNFHLAGLFPIIGLIGNCWISEVHIFLLDVDVFFCQVVAGGWWLVPCCPKTLICKGLKTRSSGTEFVENALCMLFSWLPEPSIGLHLFLHFESDSEVGTCFFLRFYHSRGWRQFFSWFYRSMAQFRCLDIIWGLLNLITWEPKNHVQNDNLRACSINHKVIMAPFIIIAFGHHYPAPKATNLGERSLVACLFSGTFVESACHRPGETKWPSDVVGKFRFGWWDSGVFCGWILLHVTSCVVGGWFGSHMSQCSQ